MWLGSTVALPWFLVVGLVTSEVVPGETGKIAPKTTEIGCGPHSPQGDVAKPNPRSQGRTQISVVLEEGLRPQPPLGIFLGLKRNLLN